MYKLKQDLLAQNRFYLFKSEQQDYLYDAFSQNIFPIETVVSNFLFSDSKNTFSENEKK